MELFTKENGSMIYFKKGKSNTPIMTSIKEHTVTGIDMERDSIYRKTVKKSIKAHGKKIKNMEQVLTYITNLGHIQYNNGDKYTGPIRMDVRDGLNSIYQWKSGEKIHC